MTEAEQMQYNAMQKALAEEQEKNKRVFLDLMVKSFSELFPACRLEFFQALVCGCEKIKLHSNGANRTRVLKGERLAFRGQGISTTLSTLVLKT